MTVWGRVQGTGLVEFVRHNPEGLYHPSIQWLALPEHLEAVADKVPLAVVDGVAQPASLDALLTYLLSLVAARRYEVETGGIRLADGTVLRTGRDNQAMLDGMVTRATRRPDATIDFKGARGWLCIDKAQVEAMADAVGEHVQACFSREKAIAAALTEARAAGDALAMLVAYCDEIDAGWPADAVAAQTVEAVAGVA